MAHGKDVRKLEGVWKTAGLVAFSPEGKYIAAVVQAGGGDDNSIECWEETTGKSVLVHKVYMGHITSIAMSPDGMHVLLAGSDKTARLWRLKE